MATVISGALMSTATLDASRAQFERSTLPVWVFDIESASMRWANRAAVQLWGARDLDGLLARDFASDMSQATRTRLGYIKERIGCGDSLQDRWTFYPAEGHSVTVDCRCSGVELADGRLAMLVEGSPVGAPDPHSVRAVEALRHTAVMTTLFDGQGAALFQNPATTAAFGPPEGLLGSFRARFAERRQATRALQTARAGDTWSAEVRVSTVDGPRWHGVEVHPTRDPVSGDAALLVNQRDITQRVEAQRELERSQAHSVGLTQQLERSERDGLMVAGVAHELNNPMTVVLLNLEVALAGARAAGDEVQAARLAEAMGATERMRSTVARLQSHAAASDGGRAQIDVNEIADRALRPLWSIARHHARIERDLGALAPVLGTAARLEQVLLHLLSNAILALPAGRPEEHRIAIRTRLEGPWVRIEVSDSGPGIPEADQALVFEPFFTTRPTGAGLGLSTCRSIVQGELGGVIGFRTRPDARAPWSPSASRLCGVPSGPPDRACMRRPPVSC